MTVGDGRWLFVMAAVTVAELLCWLVSWSAGHAPAPWLPTYLVLACASLAASLGVTFPFNILVGIPLYHRFAEYIHRLGA